MVNFQRLLELASGWLLLDGVSNPPWLLILSGVDAMGTSLKKLYKIPTSQNPSVLSNALCPLAVETWYVSTRSQFYIARERYNFRSTFFGQSDTQKDNYLVHK